MKAKRSVSLFFILGLAVAITGLVSPAMAQDEKSSASSSDSRGLTEGLAAGGEIEEDMAPAAVLPEASLRVTGSVLKPRDNDVDYINGNGGGAVYVTAGSGYTIWNAPVYLPQGSVVHHIRMYYYDNTPHASYGWFSVYDRYGEVHEEWSVGSSGASTLWRYADSGAINHTIDYNNYSYVLNWRPNHIGSDMQLAGFRIYYYPSGTRYGSALILSSPPP